jgi:hypothetical protein
VPLAALIAAYHEAEQPGGGLRATLPIAGRTVIERQAHLVAGAGAEPVVIVVERVTQALGEALDRLRADGLPVVLARSAADAAAAVPPQQPLLLVADGLVAPEPSILRLVSLEAPAVLTVPDVRADDRYERIDAESRWAGLALLDGRMLGETAAMLRDWDLQSTLLRRAIQAGARHISVRGEAEDDLPVVAEAEEDLGELEAQILAGAHTHRRGWISRYLLAPIERAVTQWLMPTSVTPTAVALAGTLLMALGALAFWKQWLGAGLAFLLLATPLEGIAERLASLRLQRQRGPSWWSSLRPLLWGAALLVLAYALAPTRGWGCYALAASVAAFLIALKGEGEGRGLVGGDWLAEPKALAWLMLPFAATNLWATGLTALAIYAGGSFFWAQRQTHAAGPAAVED